MAFVGKGGMAIETLRENSQKAKKVMDFMTRNCCQCSVSSSKRRIYKTASGEKCQLCLETSIAGAANMEHEYLEFLKAEAAKPPPEGHGSWS